MSPAMQELGATRPQPASTDAAIAEVAARQYGVVTHPQLVHLGMSRAAIQHRQRAGRLHRLHRAVYAVGHSQVPARGRLLAAVLACGPGSALSHRAAAALLGILPYAGRRIDVTTTRGGRRPGIVVHRVSRLPEEDRCLIDGIPLTSVARTLVDLARVLRSDLVERAIDNAEGQALFDLRAFDGRTMPRRLREVLHGYRDLGFTRSQLERLLARLCLDTGLDQPAMNIWIGDQEVDALWEKQRVAVLIDSWEFHRTRTAFEDDRRRVTALQLRGYRVLVVTDRRLIRSPGEVVADLRELLEIGGSVP